MHILSCVVLWFQLNIVVKQFLVFAVWKVVGKKWFLCQGGIQRGPRAKMGHAVENGNYRFGIREVDTSKGNMMNYDQNDVDENHGGVINGVNDCD